MSTDELTRCIRQCGRNPSDLTCVQEILDLLNKHSSMIYWDSRKESPLLYAIDAYLGYRRRYQDDDPSAEEKKNRMLEVIRILVNYGAHLVNDEIFFPRGSIKTRDKLPEELQEALMPQEFSLLNMLKFVD